MQKISKTKARAIKGLRKKGQGYKAIAKSLQLSPATIHKYAKKIKLSHKAKDRIAKSIRKRQKKFVDKFSQPKKVKLPNLSPKFANFLGHLFFDGSVNLHNGKYVLGYTNFSIEAIKNFNTLGKRLFGISPANGRIYNRSSVYYETRFYSKEAFNFVKQFSHSFSTCDDIGIPKEIMGANKETKRAFLQSFWDDEGCVSYKGELTGASKSERMIDDLITILSNLGIKCRKSLNQLSGCSILQLSRRLENQIKFQKAVNFAYG